MIKSGKIKKNQKQKIQETRQNEIQTDKLENRRKILKKFRTFLWAFIPHMF